MRRIISGKVRLEVAELVEVDPYRESFWSARIRALALTGRTVDAVRCYQDVRRRNVVSNYEAARFARNWYSIR